MLIKKCFLGFVVAIALGACSNEEGETNDSIILNDKSQASQTIYADETQKNDGIKFTATEPWTATVNEVKTRAGSSNVDWLTLSAYSGGAGDFTLDMSLKPNTSGKSRKAEIRIMAGKTVLTITVEQKAETENGEEVLKPIKRITYQEVSNSDKVYNSSTNYISESIRDFSYDEQGRLARIVLSKVGGYEDGRKQTLSFDYRIIGEITIKDKEVYSNTDSYEDTYLAKLNEQGNVVNLQSDEKNTGIFEDYIRFSYTNDNRLAQWKDADAGSEESSGTFSYSNGLLSKYEYVSGKYSEEGWTYNWDVNKAYMKRYPNNLLFDIFGILNDDDDLNVVFYLGRGGKTSDYLPEVVSADFLGGDDWASEGIDGYHTPGVNIEEYYYSIEWSDADLVMNYTFDPTNKSLTGIQTERSFSITKTTYTVVVGHELIDPEYPERVMSMREKIIIL